MNRRSFFLAALAVAGLATRPTSPVSQEVSVNELTAEDGHDDDLTLLVKSVREEGILSPLVVRGRVVIDGSRRLRVARLLGIKTVPCHFV